MELKFRRLRADEIDCRAQSVKKNGLVLLLYKDARCDMNILDEKVGVMNWKKSYQLIDGQLFCTLEIWDEDKKQWIGKQDVGVESNTEAEKGRASDAQKRAAFAFGIGRELYTAPFIWIKSSDCEIIDKGKDKFVCYDSFSVESIGYDDFGNINSLVIKNNRTNRVVYKMGKAQPPADDFTEVLATKIEKETFFDTCKALGVDYKIIGKQVGATSMASMTAEQHGKAMIILKDIEESRNGQ